MMAKVLGTCSLCGGLVTVPEAWWGIYPPTPTCAACGATMKHPHGLVIEMARRNTFEFVNNTFIAPDCAKDAIVWAEEYQELVRKTWERQKG